MDHPGVSSVPPCVCAHLCAVWLRRPANARRIPRPKPGSSARRAPRGPRTPWKAASGAAAAAARAAAPVPLHANRRPRRPRPPPAPSAPALVGRPAGAPPPLPGVGPTHPVIRLASIPGAPFPQGPPLLGRRSLLLFFPFFFGCPLLARRARAAPPRVGARGPWPLAARRSWRPARSRGRRLWGSPPPPPPAGAARGGRRPLSGAWRGHSVELWPPQRRRQRRQRRRRRRRRRAPPAAAAPPRP